MGVSTQPRIFGNDGVSDLPDLTGTSGVGEGDSYATLNLNFISQLYSVNGRRRAFSDIITFTRSTTATYFDSAGVLQTAAINAPRFDYDPVTHAILGYLHKDAATNLFLNSEAPVTQGITVTAVSHAVSFYGTGTIVLSGAHTATVVGTGAFPTRTTLAFTPTAGTLTCTVTGTVQKAQVEIGLFATSYIATTGTSVTRARDQMIWNGATFTAAYNAAMGSIQLEVLTGGLNTNTRFFCQLGDANYSANRKLTLEAFTSGALIRALDTGSALSIYTLAFSNTLMKIVGGYHVGTLAKKGTAQGVAVTAGASGTPPATTDRLVLGAAGNYSDPKFGRYQKLRYWATYLPDATMQAWTDLNTPVSIPTGCINYSQAYDNLAGPAAWVVQNRPAANAALQIVTGQFHLSGVGRYRLFGMTGVTNVHCIPKNLTQMTATVKRMVADGANLYRYRDPMGSASFTESATNWGMWLYPVGHATVSQRLDIDPNAFIAMDNMINSLLTEGIEVIYINDELLYNLNDRHNPKWAHGSYQSRGMIWSPTYCAAEWAVLVQWVNRPSSITAVAPIDNPRICWNWNNENGFSSSYQRDTLTAWGGSAAMNWFDKIVDDITDTSGNNGEWYAELNAELTAWKNTFQPGWTIPNWGRSGTAGFPKRSTWAGWGNAADKAQLIAFCQYVDTRYIEQRIDLMRALNPDCVINPGTFLYQSPAAQLALGPVRGTNLFLETHNYFPDDNGPGVKVANTKTRKSISDNTWTLVANGAAWSTSAVIGNQGVTMPLLSAECGQYSPNRWRYQRMYYETILALLHDYDIVQFNQSQQYTSAQYTTDGKYMVSDHVNVASPSDRLCMRALAPAQRFGFLTPHATTFVINQTLASLKIYQDANNTTPIGTFAAFQTNYQSNGSENAHWGTSKVRISMDEGQPVTTDFTLYPKVLDSAMTAGTYCRNTATEKVFVQWGFGLQVMTPYMMGFIDTITQTPKFAMGMTITNLGADAAGYVCFLRSDGLWNLFTGAMKLYIHGSDLSTQVVNQGLNGGTYEQGTANKFGTNNPPGADYFNNNDAVQVYYSGAASQLWGNGSSTKQETWIRKPPNFTLNLVSPVDLDITGVKHDGTTELLASTYSGGTWSFNYTGNYVEFLVTLA